MVSIAYTYLGYRLEEPDLERYTFRLPLHFQKKIRRLQNWRDRQVGVFGKLLLQELLHRQGYQVSCLHRLGCDNYGRPYIDRKIDFNISHAGDIVICAMVKTGRCGVDIEKITPLNVVDFYQYLPADQYKVIQNSTDRVRCFFKSWTLLESVTKADGRGLSIPLSDIKVNNATATFDQSKWFIRELDIDEQYACHLALSEDSHMIDIEKIILN